MLLSRRRGCYQRGKKCFECTLDSSVTSLSMVSLDANINHRRREKTSWLGTFALAVLSSITPRERDKKYNEHLFAFATVLSLDFD